MPAISRDFFFCFLIRVSPPKRSFSHFHSVTAVFTYTHKTPPLDTLDSPQQFVRANEQVEVMRGCQVTRTRASLGIFRFATKRAYFSEQRSKSLRDLFNDLPIIVKCKPIQIRAPSFLPDKTHPFPFIRVATTVPWCAPRSVKTIDQSLVLNVTSSS